MKTEVGLQNRRLQARDSKFESWVPLLDKPRATYEKPRTGPSSDTGVPNTIALRRDGLNREVARCGKFHDRKPIPRPAAAEAECGSEFVGTIDQATDR